MVQLSVPLRAGAPPVAQPPAEAPLTPAPVHDEHLLIAALERIELTRSALEELLDGNLSALLYA